MALSSDLLWVLGLGVLPAAGMAVGAFLADRFPLGGRGLSLALHAAAGGILAVVGVEILPRVLQGMPPWGALSLFLAGGLSFLALDAATGFVAGARDAGAGAAWTIFAGIGVDIVTDGVMVGAGANLEASLAVVLGLGLLFVDSLEGFATFSTLRARGVGRGLRWGLVVGLAALVLLGTAGGYVLLRGLPLWNHGVLAFTGGMLLTLVVEEITPEAHRGGEGRLMTLALLGGFAAFALLSAFLT